MHRRSTGTSLLRVCQPRRAAGGHLFPSQCLLLPVMIPNLVLPGAGDPPLTAWIKLYLDPAAWHGFDLEAHREKGFDDPDIRVGVW